ncbi:membrane protein [Iodidimonas muriae]|uniref:Membrane protein n=2 Tax=Iodidimonas muriae TaxID=261467 RepID=A0ABQ2LCK9_9PROT|nr:membrane protein [Kordiimonadales bacterium JCM 17843]GGO10857.1 membrane protein [Iodidimonas muriae]
MALSLGFDPIFPPWILIGLAILFAAFSALLLLRRARGSLIRTLFFAALILALSNPHLVQEDRTAMSDITVAMVDRSASNRIGDRESETDKAIDALRANIQAAGGELRVIESDRKADRTELFGPLAAALADVPPDRLSAALLITDGRIDDISRGEALTAAERPIHSLLTGNRTAPDRRIEVIRAPEFGLVDRPVTIELRIEEDNIPESGPVALTIRRFDKAPQQRMVMPGVPFEITLTPERRGEMLVDVSVETAPDETVLVNNRALFSVNAVRDRLRVLLVSGEPHPGERVWRDTLKSDPAVDLIHFTILRLPTSQDPTPVSQLSLIPFPTERLFSEQLEDFDLVIFDRYSLRGVLDVRYFSNLLSYVEGGGAIFVANGPEYAEPLSIFRTPLEQVLPASPTGTISSTGFVPALTELGRRHPVTQGLEQPGAAPWGRWFRMVDNRVIDGQVLLSGPGEQPLLVLKRAGEGRIAELMSDHVWLWARGVEGGGPYQELLRRSVHWLMKEPDLEEKALSARSDGEDIVVERRSLSGEQAMVTVTGPDGSERTLMLSPGANGIAEGRLLATEAGLYRISDGEDETVAGIGPVGGHELSRIMPTDQIVRDVAQKTGGGIFWLEDGLPDIRHPSKQATAAGNGWMGLPQRRASRIEDIAQTALLPAWAWAVILAGLLALTWRKESR